MVLYDLVKRTLGVEDGIFMFAVVTGTSVAFAARVDVLVDEKLRKQRKKLH